MTRAPALDVAPAVTSLDAQLDGVGDVAPSTEARFSPPAPRLMRQKSRSLAAASHKFLSTDEANLRTTLEQIWNQPDRESSLKSLLSEWHGGPPTASEALATLIDERTSDELRLSRNSLRDLFRPEIEQGAREPMRRRHTLQGPCERVAHQGDDHAETMDAGRSRSRTVDSHGEAPHGTPAPSWTPTLPIVLAALKLRRLGARHVPRPIAKRLTTADARRSEEEFYAECWHTQALAMRSGSLEATFDMYGAHEDAAWPADAAAALSGAHGPQPPSPPSASGVYGVKPRYRAAERGSVSNIAQHVRIAETMVEAPA